MESTSSGLTYPSQAALLQWLPLQTRVELSQKFPTIRSLSRRLSFHLRLLELRTNSHDGLDINIDGRHFEIHRKCKNPPETLVISSDSSKEFSFSVEDVVRNVMKYYLDRKGTSLDTFITETTMFLTENLCIPKIIPIEYHFTDFSTKLNFNEALNFVSPFMKFSTSFELEMFKNIYEKFKSQNRPIGTRLKVCFDQQNNFKLLKTLLINRETLQFDVKRALRKVSRKYEEDDHSYLELQCLLVEMEHADMIINIPSSEIFDVTDRNNLLYNCEIRIVEKNSVKICEENPDYWLSVRVFYEDLA